MNWDKIDREHRWHFTMMFFRRLFRLGLYSKTRLKAVEDIIISKVP